MTTFRYRYATRLNSFGSSRNSHDSLRAIAAIPGITAVEVNFPEHITIDSADLFIAEAHSLNLDLTALNLRYDPIRFAKGAFTNPDPELRRDAIQITYDAADLAARAGIPHVILWMGPDGFDYPFSANYSVLWQWTVDAIRAVAARQPGVQFSIEYKPSEPRRCSLIRSMSDSLLAVADVNLPNLGVTLDLCHSLMAGENPATAAALALDRGKLFGLHINDGYGTADDGLMVGTIHPRQTMELLWELRLHVWDRPIYFDTFPTGIDPFAECQANIAQIERFESVLDRIDVAEMQAARTAGDPVVVETILNRALAIQ